MRRLLAVVLLTVAATMVAGTATASSRTFTAHLNSREEVPSNDSRAVGQAIFRLSADGTALHYRLIAANIDNVVAAHIHLAPAGVNGPVVAWLYGPASPGGGRSNGVLAVGTITAGDLVGPLAGHSLDALVEAVRAGDTYVNVHTNDGVDPAGTGPGDLPAGEIRRQIR
jgi:hypothetical protein